MNTAQRAKAICRCEWLESSGSALRRIPSREIRLAKIVCFRYIAFTSLIRYLDVRIALTCEDIPKACHSFRFSRSCIGRGRPSEC